MRNMEFGVIWRCFGGVLEWYGGRVSSWRWERVEEDDIKWGGSEPSGLSRWENFQISTV